MKHLIDDARHAEEDRIVDELMSDPAQARKVHARLQERLTAPAKAVRKMHVVDTSLEDMWDNVPV